MFDPIHALRLRRLLAAPMLLAAAGLAGAASASTDFPSRPVTLIVPFPAGGTPDILARSTGEIVARELGQSVVIENRGGAGGSIGTRAVVQAKPDGYTLLVCAINCGIAPVLYKPAPYTVERDLAPVALLGTVPSVLVVHPSVPAKNLTELVAYAKANPGKLNSASSGFGTSAHMATELFRSRLGVDVVHVPYKGSSQVAVDLLSGQVQMYFDNLPTSLASIRSGKLRAMGVAGDKRSPAIPDVPTFAEAGIADFRITPWFGVMAPAGTPTAILERLNQAFNKALRDPAAQEKMQQLGVDAAPGSREALSAFVAGETAMWADVIKNNTIEVQ